MPHHVEPHTLALIDHVREMLLELAPNVHWEETTLFGHHAFMCNGKFLCGVRGQELLVRLDAAEHEAALQAGALELKNGPGIMRGWMRLPPPLWGHSAAIRLWLTRALTFNPHARAAPRRKSPIATPHADDGKEIAQQQYPSYFH